MLRLQRGEPVCFLCPVDCAPRNVADGDRIHVFNDIGTFEALAKVSPHVQPGEGIISSTAWEPYQFRKWQGQQEPVAASWKAIHVAGGYGHIHYRQVLRLTRPRPTRRTGGRGEGVSAGSRHRRGARPAHR